MSLYDELVRTSPCKLCDYIDSRPVAEQKDWAESLARPEVSSTKVVKYLQVRGFTLDEASVRRHRLNHAVQ